MELILKAIILGVVEGVTEFLPISSTGHLILFGHFLHFTGPFAILFEIVIQLGAILAVVYYYRQKILDSLKHLRPGQWGFTLWFCMLIAFLPAAVVGLILKEPIDTYLFSPFTVSIALIVGALLMIIVENNFSSQKNSDFVHVGVKKSLLIGFAQCLSLFPGMSRSASTIMGGMIVGLSVKAAAEFSFFLAIPTMVAATGYSLLKGFQAMTSLEWAALAVGFLVSFLVALIVIGKFLSFLVSHSLKGFAYYRLLVGIGMLALIWAGIVV
ncbi:MAG: undecaprenyl-diphosphate phosphatase [Peptococcaceae bacterium]|jgi:undecaprenyl-diphosphatase|nr:undecaprenyl-diphosphate phosphatase [Peptococcaceae bacterium]